MSLGGACLGPVIIPDSEERRLGEALASRLEASDEIEILHDRRIEAYLNHIGARLIAASPRKRPFDFQFKVVRSDEVNAFALPGGFCYVNTGLFLAVETEAELVGVLAHELSHVNCGHHRNAYATSLFINTAQGLVFNEDSPELAVAVGNIIAKGSMLHFSRYEENQADEVGCLTMYRAGWNPDGMIEFFEKLLALEKSPPSAFSKLLSTHPPTAERIRHLRELVAQLPPKRNLIRDTPEFHFIQARVRRLTVH